MFSSQMLMEKVYELRDQAIKAKQEMAVHQEENKELKSKLEQVRYHVCISK